MATGRPGGARALQEIGSFAQADRAYVFQVSADGRFISNTFEWCAEGIAPQIDRLHNVPFDDAMLFCRTIKRFAIVDYPSIDDLPAEAEVDRALLAAQAIQSLLAVPMVANDRLVGFIGLDSVRTARVWLDEEKTLMTLVGNAFTGVLERKRADDSLRASEARYRSVVESVKEVIFQLDGGGALGLPQSLVGRSDRVCDRGYAGHGAHRLRACGRPRAPCGGAGSGAARGSGHLRGGWF